MFVVCGKQRTSSKNSVYNQKNQPLFYRRRAASSEPHAHTTPPFLMTRYLGGATDCGKCSAVLAKYERGKTRLCKGNAAVLFLSRNMSVAI